MTTQEFALKNAVALIHSEIAPFACFTESGFIEVPFNQLNEGVWATYDDMVSLFTGKCWTVSIGVTMIATPVIIIKSKQF